MGGRKTLRAYRTRLPQPPLRGPESRLESRGIVANDPGVAGAASDKLPGYGQTLKGRRFAEP